MRHLIPVASVFSTMLLAACGRAPEMDNQLKQDLQAASTGTIELAPNAPATKVVSAIESKQPVQPRMTPVRRVKAPARTPRPETPQVIQASTQRTQTSSEPAAVRPLPASSISPPPPGGYKTVNEVIRNAPFPIKP